MFIVQATGWALAYEQNFYNIKKQSFCHDTQQSGTQHNGTQHDTQHNDTQHYDVKYSDTQHKDTQNTKKKVTLSLIAFNAYGKCDYIYAVVQQSLYTECHHAECRYTECNGPILIVNTKNLPFNAFSIPLKTFLY